MKKAFKHLLLVAAFLASLGVVLHAAHPDSNHVSGSGHNCGLCQTLTLSDAPAAEIQAPRWVADQTILPHSFVFAVNCLALLPDTRGPPL